ncbi:MAG: hypothetical protein IPM32_07800 [Ignavibacteriae bacterium]|nr:hypothetical protein [Ignavibacteriota bacterium]
MGMDNPKEVEDKLSAMPEYVGNVCESISSKSKISWDNLGEAVAAFERNINYKR